MAENIFDIAVLGELEGNDLKEFLLINLSRKSSSFRFTAEHLQQLTDLLRTPAEIRTDRRCSTTGLEALCICLRRLVYPNRLADLEPLFGLSALYLSVIANTVLTYEKSEQYSQAITNRNAPLTTCWGFIDGTARPICRPSLQQQEYFSGHKRTHCVKYQSAVSPDGIICSLKGAYPETRHDAGIFRESGLYEQYTFPNKKFVLYGDPAYSVQELLIAPYRNRNHTDEQHAFNFKRSAVRQAVE
ncbi:hypothetical protein ILUMI_24296 [Ignelater luminosus]|uniref:DDE Tnp4 domain-containing protein n=1 Tax=Ignelater luminosus TaxID=2038154 RepID=A0A8K0FWM4_IGNLU|nr:hypothetical protein ILUMI_24296 [Ignelater luminosus]